MEFETFKYNCDNLPIDMEEHSYMEEHYCNEFVYSAEIYQSTSVTEFNLVCERNHLKSLIGRIVEVCPSYPFFWWWIPDCGCYLLWNSYWLNPIKRQNFWWKGHTSTTPLIGMGDVVSYGIGASLLGSFSDRFGRKKMIILAIAMLVVFHSSSRTVEVWPYRLNSAFVIYSKIISIIAKSWKIEDFIWFCCIWVYYIAKPWLLADYLDFSSWIYFNQSNCLIKSTLVPDSIFRRFCHFGNSHYFSVFKYFLNILSIWTAKVIYLNKYWCVDFKDDGQIS